MANNRDFKVLNEREHILTRPAMYIGSIVATEKEQWVYDGKKNKFNWQTTKFAPALLKICDEIVDNSLDVAIDTDFKKITTVKVKVTEDTITVEDDGPGIPVAPPKGGDEQGRNCPEIAWTQMRSGTSFKENRKGPSANGVGSTCCNVFCTSFIGTSDDGKKRQTVSCADNMSIINVSEEEKSKGKSGVKVEMKPDLKRFKMKKIDEKHQSLIYQRLLNLAICYPQLNFYFNGKKIAVNGKKFAAMFSDDAIVETSDNATVVVFPNEYDEFKFYSYVNGLNCIRGGSQVDFVASEICSRVRDKLIKKYKTIRPGDIKNKLGLVVFLTDFENAQFDAQTKESLANSPSDINKHLNGAIDFDKIAKNIQKTESIINPIVDTFKIKEELKAKKEIKSSKKVKVKSDKYMSSIGEKKYLCLCEGASAASGLSACLGRNGFGYYAMRGLPINAYSQSMQKISANQEFKDVMNILGLDVTKPASEQELNYITALVSTDSDSDGCHLSAMLVGWFKRFAPELFEMGRICKLVTPLILVKDNKGKITDYFFTVSEFNEWEKKKGKGNIFYLKGLGSWEREDLQYLIDKEGFERFIKKFVLDKNSDRVIEEWLGDDTEPRKKYLRNCNFNIDKV